MTAISALFKNPFIFPAYLLVILALIACWAYRKYYLYAPLYVLSYACGYAAKIVTIESIFPLLIILGGLLSLKAHAKRFIHLFVTMFIAITGFAIMMHMLNGFHNIQLYKGLTFGDSTIPVNIYLNYDKISLAVLLLGISIPLVQQKEQWKQVMLVTVLWTLLSAFVLLAYAKFSGLATFDFKVPSISLIWLIVNFFFVVIPEEAFYRGFLQKEITKNLPNKAAPLLAILSVSILFTLVHVLFIPNIVFLFSVFLSSVLYGTVYHITESIESCIVTHFAVNVVHFFFFSYPMLS